MNKTIRFSTKGRERITQLLVESNLNITDFCKSIGVNYKSYTHWTYYGTTPSVYSLVKISSVYHVSVDWLLGLTDVREIQRVSERDKNGN